MKTGQAMGFYQQGEYLQHCRVRPCTCTILCLGTVIVSIIHECPHLWNKMYNDEYIITCYSRQGYVVNTLLWYIEDI